MVKYIILPTNLYYIVWISFISLVYIISYGTDLFDMAFALTPLQIPSVKHLQTVCSFLMIIDVLSGFFVAKDKDGKQNNTEIDPYEDEEEEDETMTIGSFKIQRSLTLRK